MPTGVATPASTSSLLSAREALMKARRQQHEKFEETRVQDQLKRLEATGSKLRDFEEEHRQSAEQMVLLERRMRWALTSRFLSGREDLESRRYLAKEAVRRPDAAGPEQSTA